MTPDLFSSDWRKQVAEACVWGKPPGQFLTRQAIQNRVEKVLERIAKQVVLLESQQAVRVVREGNGDTARNLLA
jgi:hypothetical protein